MILIIADIHLNSSMSIHFVDRILYEYLFIMGICQIAEDSSSVVFRNVFGPGPAQSKSARAYIPTWPKVGPGPKMAQRTLAQIGLGPNIFGPGPAQEIVGPDKWS